MPLHRPRVRVRPMGAFSLNRMIPNILTLLALCAGMTAIRLAVLDRFEQATAAIIIAGILDGIDGRIARLLKGTSSFGAELDSLSDFVSFGAAPAIMLDIWTMDTLHGIGWALALLFAVCTALRLARFNTQIGAELPPYAYNFFTGVPAPAGAGLALFPLFVGLEAQSLDWSWLLAAARFPLFNAFVLIGTAALLVSTLPVWSFKNFKVPAEYVLPLMVGVGAYVAFLVADAWGALALLALAYLGMLPFSRRSFHRLRAEAEAMRAPEEPSGSRQAS